MTSNSVSPMRHDTAAIPAAPPPPPTMSSPFMTPLRSNRSQSEGMRPAGTTAATTLPQTVEEIPTLDDVHHNRQIVIGPLASSLRSHRRVRSNGSVGMHSVTFEALRDEGDDQHSLGDSLGDSTFSYQDDDDDGLSITSKSLDSSIVRNVALTIPELVSTGRKSTHRLADGKTLQHSDRRVSLRPDLETGKKAGTRGQKVVRRSVSTMEPQPPRLRRRTGMKNML